MHHDFLHAGGPMHAAGGYFLAPLPLTQPESVTAEALSLFERQRLIRS